MNAVLTVESDLLDEFWHKDVHRSSHTASDVCGTARDVTYKQNLKVSLIPLTLRQKGENTEAEKFYQKAYFNIL